MEYDEKKHPMIWKRKSTRGYCFTAEIPCRILEMKKKVKIAALLVDGRERNHWVEEESLRHSPCMCFGRCKALDRFRGKIVRKHEEPREPRAFGDMGTHKYNGFELREKIGIFLTSECSYGCGCWMGKSMSGGPPGIDPFGACPKAPAMVKA